MPQPDIVIESSVWKQITPSSFVRGVIHWAALAEGGALEFNLHDRQLHAALTEAYIHLRRQAESVGAAVRFVISPHPMHGDSTVLTEELSHLLYLGGTRGVGGSFVNLRYDATHPISELVAVELPGAPELYRELAAVAIEAYSQPT